MTDPRLDDQLLAAIRRLPSGSGVIFRHYALETKQRRHLFARVRHICVQRGHILMLAGDARTARLWGADGVHGRGVSAKPLLLSAPVHNPCEIERAKRHGAGIMFLSPLQKTRSHPGERALGALAFSRLARLCRPGLVIALGGMNRVEAAKWPQKMVHGWAAIDAFKR
ncbi:MAG TPA: thiamine phosphate synthase [Sphingorhabdus sp.]|nr:thiamine phosphate synthase [Sphingorhabdus sp.]